MALTAVIPPLSPDWELTRTSPARRRQSAQLTTMARPPKRKRNTCAALYSGGIGCSLSPVDGMQWCARHNEQRLKLYTNYKVHGALLAAFPDIAACNDSEAVMKCDSLDLLREWNTHLLGKYNLLTRCIEARVYFTRRFFGEDMDFGHKKFWEGLVRQRSEVERLMSCVEKRGYQLILRDQDALWVLEQEKHEPDACTEYGYPATGTNASLYSMDSVESVVDEDPLEAVLREKAIQIRDQIRLRLAWYCASPTSRFHDERLEAIYAFVRRAIYLDASLMFLSQSYDSVTALLNDENLDFATVERIWNAICSLCIHDVQSAVDDVIRHTNGDYVVVLGGKVFKSLSGERWPLHAWGHMTAFRDCYSCLRTTCRTIDQVIDLTRYALFTQTPLHQSYIKYEFNIDGSTELILAGFITSDIPRSASRGSVICKESSSGSEGPIWEETKRNFPLYAGLSLCDPAAQAFVNACIRHPDLMVMLRKGADARIIRSPPVVWTSWKRSAPSRSALISAPWDKAKNIVKLSDLALADAQPAGWGQDRIADCMQVIVVDTSEGTMGDFVQRLVGIWCQVHHVGDKGELYDVIKAPYDAAGELEAYEEMTSEIAVEHYKRLWGCMPPPSVVENLEDVIQA